jgi:hypothetical protein
MADDGDSGPGRFEQDFEGSGSLTLTYEFRSFIRICDLENAYITSKLFMGKSTGLTMGHDGHGFKFANSKSLPEGMTSL